MMEFLPVTPPEVGPRQIVFPPTRRDSKKALVHEVTEKNVLLMNLPFAPLSTEEERLYNSCPLNGFSLDDDSDNDERETTEQGGFLQPGPSTHQWLVDACLAKMAEQGSTKLNFIRPKIMKKKKKKAGTSGWLPNTSSFKTNTADRSTPRYGLRRSPIRRSASAASCA
ncbi:expressed unknown protein [Seminavis robusta]|uniref:Uncharacterized protein n=1 Tax=Seminavis robusta TaxID=568900 RepID=A0A9N8ER50_9STRA|nr:expressed unknown protein [Seminavis robusta]|eukprot:Sro1603_g285290.1 n/a (168) ;mRNA; r:6340-6843